MPDDDKDTLMVKFKLLIWSASAGIIVAFFFASNFLAWATHFNPGGSALFISPLMCGLILGIVTYEMEAVNTVTATIIMTITATAGVILTLLAPMILGIVTDPSGSQLFIYVPQNMMITIILVLPISLLGSILGRLFAENTLFSSSLRTERNVLKSETEEWYKMLEEKLEEKKAALEKVKEEQKANLAQDLESNNPPVL
jgi:voltage-gated potassium channel Kch